MKAIPGRTGKRERRTGGGVVKEAEGAKNGNGDASQHHYQC